MTGNIVSSKLTFLFFLLLFFIHPIRSQAQVKIRSTLCVSGSSNTVTIQDRQFFFQQTVGQPGITGLSGQNKYLLRQGFIQPLKGSGKITESERLQVEIKPNPFSSDITLSFDEEIAGDLYVSLYDLSGKTVYIKKFAAAQEIYLNFGTIPVAFYVLRVYSENKYYISKLIKTRD